METKDLLEYLGIEATTMDDFKAKFPEKYTGDEKTAAARYLKPIVGKTLSKIKQNVLNKAREEGIEFNISEFDELEIEAVHDLISEKKALKFKSELEEFKKKAPAANDEAVKEWQEKLEKATKRANDEAKLRQDLAGEYESFKGKAASEVKSVRLDYAKKEWTEKLKFKPTISPLEKEGFNSHVEKNYKFDFDDTGKAFVTDAQGNRIRSAKKADEFKSPDEVLMEAAGQYNLLAENPNAGVPITKPFTPQQNGTPPVEGSSAPRRKINPMFD